MSRDRLLNVSLVVAVLAAAAPAAHGLEMANKLALDGPLWLAVQQHLYRGWGPFVGAPAEIGGLVINAILAAAPGTDRTVRRCCASAALLYALMIGVFFFFNQPVNAALDGWTAASLPPDWADYRWRWETGHAIALALSVIAAIRVGTAWLAVRERRAAPA